MIKELRPSPGKRGIGKVREFDLALDRLIHCSHKIQLQGRESMRMRTGKEGTKV